MKRCPPCFKWTCKNDDKNHSGEDHLLHAKIATRGLPDTIVTENDSLSRLFLKENGIHRVVHDFSVSQSVNRLTLQTQWLVNVWGNLY